MINQPTQQWMWFDLFSILGLNDTKLDVRILNTCGATLSIFMDLKDQIDSVYLFQSKTGDEKDLIT